MKRIEIYVDYDGNLVLTEFKNYNSEYETKILKGSQTYEYIRKLASSKLLDICEYKMRDDILLEYKNYVININEYEKVFQKRGMGPLIKNIKNFDENITIKENKGKKVKRKKKYSGKKMVAVGLSAFVIGMTAIGAMGKKDDVDKNSDNSLIYYSEEFDKEQNNVITNQIKFKENIDSDDSIEQIQLNENVNDDIVSVSIDYSDRSSTDKAIKTQSYYSKIIDKYSKIYGLDSNLVTAIATQERGIHSPTMDEGGATGLMQIQNSVWEDQYLTAYNFDTGNSEKIKVNSNNLSNLDYNIKIGCMILQNTMKYMNYNILAAVQCYNMGYGNMEKILRNYSKDTQKSIDNILMDTNDNGWLNYRTLINVGDQQYVEHVLSWIGEDINITSKKTDGSVIKLNVNNNISKKVY